MGGKALKAEPVALPARRTVVDHVVELALAELRREHGLHLAHAKPLPLPVRRVVEEEADRLGLPRRCPRDEQRAGPRRPAKRRRVAVARAQERVVGIGHVELLVAARVPLHGGVMGARR